MNDNLERIGLSPRCVRGYDITVRIEVDQHGTARSDLKLRRHG